MVDTRRMNDEARRYHNEQRAKIESLCFEIIQEWQNTDQNVPIPKDWLKTVVDKYFYPEKYVQHSEEEEAKPITVREAVEAFIADAPNRIQENGVHQGQPVCHRTILQYNQMRRFVFEYMDTLSPNDMPVKELDKKF